MQHRIETQIQEDRKVIFNDLPFHKGEKVVIAVEKSNMGTSGKCIKCGKPISYGNLYCKACGGTGIRSVGEQ